MKAKYHYLQHLAHRMLNLAIKQGDITPGQKCEDCGFLFPYRLDGHHEDYSKPFDVIWVCRSCHKKRHDVGFTNRQRPADKLSRTINWLRDNPGHLSTSSRKLSPIIGVSHTLVHRAQQILQAVSAAYANEGEIPDDVINEILTGWR